jgi:hypothetical protein
MSSQIDDNQSDLCKFGMDIRSLKYKKSPHPDNICTEEVKVVLIEIWHPVIKIIRKKEGIPDYWKNDALL